MSAIIDIKIGKNVVGNRKDKGLQEAIHLLLVIIA